MMDQTEDARDELLALLEGPLGSRGAAMLMEYLPARPGSEMATKGDVALLAERMDAGFDHMERRFEGIDRRFERMDARLDRMDDRFDRMDDRFDRMDERFERMEDRFGHQDEVLRLRAEASDARMEAFVRERIDAQTKLLVFAILGAVLTAASIALGSAAL